MRTTYYNGLVYAGELPLVTAFAVEDGRFVAVGSDAELLAAESQEKIDLDGKFAETSFGNIKDGLATEKNRRRYPKWMKIV